MFYIYLEKKDGSKFVVATNVSIQLIDVETTKYENREDYLSNLLRVNSIPTNITEKVLLRKEDEEETLDLGEILYSDSVSVLNIEANKEKILEKGKNPNYVISFLNRYLKLISGKGISENIINEVKKLLSLFEDKGEMYFNFGIAYFCTLIGEIFLDYEAYRFAYLTNKSLESEKKKVKCITKNIKGRRKIH